MTVIKLARALSFVFHPLLMPLYTLLLLLNLSSFLSQSLPVSIKLTLAGVVFLTTVLSPLVLTWMLQRLGFVTSFFMLRKEERSYPILAITVFYYLTYFLLKGVHVSTLFNYYMLGATLLSIMALGINYFRMISLHMIAAGSVTGLLLGLSLNFGIDLSGITVISVMVSGVIGFARLETGAHLPADVYSGYGLGVAVMTLLIVLL
jgi:hypothetical protein